MAIDNIMAVRLLVGDVPSSPFYQLFTDEEVQYFLDVNNNNVQQATRMAAISASFQLAGWNARERVGEIEIWSSLSTNYLKALANLISNPTLSLPNGLMPWAGGISREEVCANDRNKNNIQSPMFNVKICDADDICNDTLGC